MSTDRNSDRISSRKAEHIAIALSEQVEGRADASWEGVIFGPTLQWAEQRGLIS